jgi:outer membrane lipase/esterase
VKRSVLISVFVFVLLIPVAHPRSGYSSLFVFGDSLSDSGNNAIVLAPNVTPVPIAGNDFVATFPYASGGYTNTQVWAQVLASSLGLSATASLAGGTDYAFGGATTGPLNSIPPSLEAQAALFLAQHGPMIPGDALYVVEGGGENAQNALDLIGSSCGGSPACIGGIIQSTAAGFVADIENIDSKLEAAGAKSLVVWDVPDLGKAPAVLATGPGASMLGTTIAVAMNQALGEAIGSDPDIKLFDDFGLLNEVIADPGAFDLSNVTDACAQFIACDPSKFLFWDGIHPTSAAEAIISDAIEALVVPEPSTLALLAVALFGLGFIRFAGITRAPALRQRGSDNFSPGLGTLRQKRKPVIEA